MNITFRCPVCEGAWVANARGPCPHCETYILDGDQLHKPRHFRTIKRDGTRNRIFVKIGNQYQEVHVEDARK